MVRFSNKTWKGYPKLIMQEAEINNSGFEAAGLI